MHVKVRLYRSRPLIHPDNKRRDYRERQVRRMPCEDTHLHRVKGHVTIKAEMFLKAKECQGLLVDTRSWG